MRFAGKLVWITGASSGIGEALARAFDREGADLVLSARRADELARVVDTLTGDGERLVLPLDLARPETLADAVGQVKERFGGVDILINNAGITMRAPVAKADMAVYRELMEVNFFGPLALAKLALPLMAERGGGRLVVISSIAAKYSTPMRSGYSASKAALERVFDSLRAESWADGVALTIIVLGSADTDISINARTADGAAYGRKNRIQAEGMDPADVARRILDAVARGRDEVMIAPLWQSWHVWRARFFPSYGRRKLRMPQRKSPRT